ncbi:hypothetical protein G9A89_006611 [Geosiphon pyriformis]|nr:hypothetical protein G9A89_006611 [Geosiphon pyriformis]
MVFSKASSITEFMAKMGDCVDVPFKTEKLSPQRISNVLQAEKILSERILERILRAVSINAMRWVFVRTLSHSYGLGIIETQTSFQEPETDS